ncbi:MAG: hypothetical protein R6V02_07820 [Candidatus Aminicenantes bacterium]
MDQKTEKWIFPTASKCLECLNQAIHAFDDILAGKGSQEMFYRGRGYLREGKSYFETALKEAKKLLGPLPDYVKEDYRARRKQISEQHDILAKSRDYEILLKELHQDEFLKLVMGEEDIQRHLRNHYDRQQEGMRKLAHIKVRILLDELQERLDSARSKEKEIIRRRTTG